MKRCIPIFLTLFSLIGCNLVEPESQNNLISQTYISPGPLDSCRFSISYFDEEQSQLGVVHDLVAEVIIFGNSIQTFSLHHRNGFLFQVNNSELILKEGDSLALRGIWQNHVLEAGTQIPTRPDSLRLNIDTLLLGPVYGLEQVTILWNPTVDIHLISRIKNGSNVLPFPFGYSDSWPNNRNDLGKSLPTGSGQIVIRPWNLKGVGENEVHVFWFNSNLSELYKDPIQSGLFEPGFGIENGLGYFQGFATDTFFVQVSF